jgi:nucleotide-binding universal stress UspA family protein
MKSFKRDHLLIIGLILLLGVVTAATAAQQTQREVAPPLASDSSAPEGGRALFLWLEAMGYRVSDQVQQTFAIPEEARLVLMLEPTVNPEPTEWEILDSWVEEGGQLVVVGHRVGALLAAKHFGFDLLLMSEATQPLTPQTPLFRSPPQIEPAAVQSQAYFRSERDDFVTHLAIERGPVLVSFERGRGRVVLCAASFPFSNGGLKEPGNPSLVLNLVVGSRSGLIWFDEWHHGRRPVTAEVIGLGNWLRRTPGGRSLLYVASVTFLAIVLSGRRFGRPVPLPRQTQRRPPLEFISAMANLARRAGHRNALQRHYHNGLKRALGQRYRLNPAISDAAFVSQLARFRPDLDTQSLADLLARLRRRNLSERDMVQCAAEVADWQKES